jgi:putative ABC transport system substrate-binding protein
MKSTLCDRTLSFLRSLLIVLLFWCFALPAQAADKTIGVIMTGDLTYYRKIHEAFMEEMAAQGLDADKVQVFLQIPTPGALSWTNAARKFIAYDVDMIVCYGMPATMAVLKERSGIPVIFAGVYYPHTLALDEGNATGISSNVPVATIIKHLKSISDFTQLGVIYNASEKDTLLEVNNINSLESKFLFHTVTFDIREEKDTAKIVNVDALLFTTGSAGMSHVNSVIRVARNAKIPTAAALGGEEDKGIILTIDADPREQGVTAAKMVAQVFKGKKPADIPVTLPRKVDIVVNLKEATRLGFKVPFSLLTAATRVIK